MLVSPTGIMRNFTLSSIAAVTINKNTGIKHLMSHVASATMDFGVFLLVGTLFFSLVTCLRPLGCLAGFLRVLFVILTCSLCFIFTNATHLLHSRFYAPVLMLIMVPDTFTNKVNTGNVCRIFNCCIHYIPYFAAFNN